MNMNVPGSLFIGIHSSVILAALDDADDDERSDFNDGKDLVVPRAERYHRARGSRVQVLISRAFKFGRCESHVQSIEFSPSPLKSIPRICFTIFSSFSSASVFSFDPLSNGKRDAIPLMITCGCIPRNGASNATRPIMRFECLDLLTATSAARRPPNECPRRIIGPGGCVLSQSTNLFVASEIGLRVLLRYKQLSSFMPEGRRGARWTWRSVGSAFIHSSNHLVIRAKQTGILT